MAEHLRESTWRLELPSYAEISIYLIGRFIVFEHRGACGKPRAAFRNVSYVQLVLVHSDRLENAEVERRK